MADYAKMTAKQVANALRGSLPTASTTTGDTALPDALVERAAELLSKGE